MNESKLDTLLSPESRPVLSTQPLVMEKDYLYQSNHLSQKKKYLIWKQKSVPMQFMFKRLSFHLKFSH